MEYLIKIPILSLSSIIVLFILSKLMEIRNFTIKYV